MSVKIHNIPGDQAPAFDEGPEAIVELKAVASVLGAAGFAANQLGHYVRTIIIRLNDGRYEIMQNPILTPVENPVLVTEREGCYSLPGYTAMVERHKEINVKYISEFGEARQGLLSGPEARCAQHEVDHLDGIMISDKNSGFGQSKLKQIRRRFEKYGYCYAVDELGQFDFAPTA